MKLTSFLPNYSTPLLFKVSNPKSLEDNMGSLSVKEGYAYYNNTLNTSDYSVYLDGFASAAYTTLDMPNASFWDSDGSLSTTNSHFENMRFLEMITCRGYGAGAGLELHPLKERWDHFYMNCRAPYSCVDSTISLQRDKDLKNYIDYSLDGLQSCENCTLMGNSSIISFVNGTSDSNITTKIDSYGLLTMKNGNFILDGWAYQGSFNMGGVFDGYNSTIICSNYTQCNIYCDGSHSCYGLSLLCDDTSDCKVEYCDNSHIWCPLGTNYKITDIDS